MGLLSLFRIRQFYTIAIVVLILLQQTVTVSLAGSNNLNFESPTQAMEFAMPQHQQSRISHLSMIQSRSLERNFVTLHLVRLEHESDGDGQLERLQKSESEGDERL